MKVFFLSILSDYFDHNLLLIKKKIKSKQISNIVLISHILQSNLLPLYMISVKIVEEV